MWSYYSRDHIESNNIDQINDRLFLAGIEGRRSDYLTAFDIKHVIRLLSSEELYLISTNYRHVVQEPEYRLIETQTVIKCTRTDGVPVEELPFNITDSVKTKILPIVETIREYVNRVAPDRVLIHCRAGISRSATVVIALLMHEGYTLDQAMNLVRSKRPIINPNSQFRIDLFKLNQTLALERSTILDKNDG